MNRLPALVPAISRPICQPICRPMTFGEHFRFAMICSGYITLAGVAYYGKETIDRRFQGIRDDSDTIHRMLRNESDTKQHNLRVESDTKHHLQMNESDTYHARRRLEDQLLLNNNPFPRWLRWW